MYIILKLPTNIKKIILHKIVPDKKPVNYISAIQWNIIADTHTICRWMNHKVFPEVDSRHTDQIIKEPKHICEKLYD